MRENDIKVMPMVSVIMPAYNCEATVTAAIKSVVRQSYPNWELIIINDGSSDSTQFTLSQVAEVDSRIKLVRFDVNRGVSSARNMGLKLASGTYLCFLDADDVWFKDKLAIQVAKMESEEQAVCCSTAYIRFRFDKCSLSGKVIHPGKARKSFKDLIKHNSICNSSAMVNRTLLPKSVMYNTIKHEDYDFWLRVLQFGDCVSIDDCLCAYRVSDDSLSSNKFRSIAWHFNVVSQYAIRRLDFIQYCLGYIIGHFQRRLRSSSPDVNLLAELKSIIDG